MKILYIDSRVGDKIYGHYNTIYHGLVNSEHDTKLIKTNSLNKTIIDQFKNFDLIMIGYGYMSQGTSFPYSFRFKTKTPVITFLYKFSQCTGLKINFMKENSMIIVGSQSRIPEIEENYKIKIFPVLYPFNSETFKDYKLEKVYDIGMSGALHGAKHYSDNSFLPEERNIREKLKNLIENSGLNYFLKVSDISAEKSRIMNDVDYAKTINKSKIWVATNAEYGDLTPRFCEVPACKTLLFCNEQYYNTFENILKNGVNCVYFKNDLSDFLEKVNYYLTNEKEYNKIVENGYSYFHENHSTVKRIDELIDLSLNISN